MTLVYKLDLDIPKMYAYLTPKTKFLGQGFQKSDRHKHTNTHTFVANFNFNIPQV